MVGLLFYSLNWEFIIQFKPCLPYHMIYNLIPYSKTMLKIQQPNSSDLDHYKTHWLMCTMHFDFEL